MLERESDVTNSRAKKRERQREREKERERIALFLSERLLLEEVKVRENPRERCWFS